MYLQLEEVCRELEAEKLKSAGASAQAAQLQENSYEAAQVPVQWAGGLISFKKSRVSRLHCILHGSDY
eukprot:1158171-Pelagomonas_calceolata.AAC.8